MLPPKYRRIGLLLMLAGLGLWLLIASPAGLRPDSLARQEAQLALAPGRTGGVVDSAAPVELGMVRGEPVSPVSVDVRTLPSGPAEVDNLLQRYKEGQLDFEVNEGPVSESAFQAMVAESMRAGVDRTVQNYTPENVLGALTTGSNWKSIDYTQSQQGVPPDPEIMVGRDHVVASVNTSFQVFDKNGVSLVGPLLFDTFWGSNCGTGSANMVLFDPFSSYDEQANRYVLGITGYDSAVNGGNNGYACIAVSKTDSAAGEWWLYSFDGNPGTGTDYFFDYPHLGVGQQALYLGANMFGSFFIRNHVFAFDKNAMYAGLTANSVKFDVGSANFTIQPADLHGYTTGGWPTNPNEPHYFVDAQYGTGQTTLTVWKFTDPFGTASFTSAGTVTVNSYNLPVNQKQSGGSDMQGNDNRLLDVEYRAGKLWATHTVGCNPGTGTVNCVRWYEINISTGTPSLVQQGTFSSNGDGRSFPDLAVNRCGDMLVGYTKTNTTSWPSVYVAGREVADATGTLKSETLLHAGEAVYTSYDTVPYRWGDYMGMTIDPDGERFWHVGEYSRSQATARWSTWVGSFTWSGCVGGGPTPTPGPTATNTPLPTATNTPGPQTCTTYASTDVPKTISASGTPSVSSIISVASGGTIVDVNVKNLVGTHTWINDLDFNLTSPAATAVQIMAQSCSSEDNWNLNLDDEAAPGSWPCPPTGGGTYQPSNPLSAFDGQSSTGTWTLRIDDNANLDGGSLTSWSLEICTSGVAPTPTNTPPGPTPTNTPVPPTPTNTPVPGGDPLVYLSSSSSGTAGGVTFENEDVLIYNKTTGTYTMFFDGTDVSLGGTDLDAFNLLSDGSILLSVYASTWTLPDVGTIEDSDIVKFIPTSTGTTTAGTYEMYFDGSDVGLTTSGEDIDAIAFTSTGDLLVSTLGSFSVTGASGVDEDLIKFTATSLGWTTAGTWAMYFDGSDVSLSASTEDVWGTWVDDLNGDIYLTTSGAFSVTGVSGDGSDIFICDPITTGSTTSCTWNPVLYFDGSTMGFSGEVVDAIEIVK